MKETSITEQLAPIPETTKKGAETVETGMESENEAEIVRLQLETTEKEAGLAIDGISTAESEGAPTEKIDELREEARGIEEDLLALRGQIEAQGKGAMISLEPAETEMAASERTEMEGAGNEREKRIREEYEYTDAEGGLIGKAIAEYERDSRRVNSPDANRDIEGREIRSFRIVGPKGEIDILAFISPSPTVLVSKERSKDYFNGPDGLVVPPLESPLDVGVMLHELGHEAQKQESQFLTIQEGSAMRRTQFAAPTSEDLEKLISLFPDVQERVKPEDLLRLKDLEEQRDRVKSEIFGLERKGNMLERRRNGLLNRELRSTMPFSYDEIRKIERELSTQAEDTEEQRMYEKLQALGIIRMDAIHEPSGPAAMTVEHTGILKEPKRPTEQSPYAPLSLIKECRVLTALERQSFSWDNLDLTYDDTAKKMTAQIRISTRETALHSSAPLFHATISMNANKEQYEKILATRTEFQDEEKELMQAEKNAQHQTEQIAKDIYSQLDSINAYDLMHLPTRILERDATRRAFGWLRQIRKQTGADLFKPVIAKRSELLANSENSCAQSMGQDDSEAEPSESATVADVRSQMKAALRSYGAEKSVPRPQKI